MTYSPLLSVAPDQHDSSGLVSYTLLLRVGCLLQCPTDTPKLWQRVLSLVCEALSGCGAQLFLAPSFEHDTDTDYGSGAIASLPVEARTLLWQHLGASLSNAANGVLQHPLNDLQAQLATLVEDGRFRLANPRTFAADQWPVELMQIFGPSKGRYLALLLLSGSAEDPVTNPVTKQSNESLASQPACMGAVVIFRDREQGDWSAADLELLADVGSQIYLAIRRSHLDQAAKTCSARDQLTQLPDRMLFNQHMAVAIATAIETDMMLGVAFLDLDRFKNINETLGHTAGDCLLQQVAERLKSCTRSYDVVARWGGDEFTLLLPALRSPEDVSHIAERILQRLSAPFQVQGEELYITASLGIALAPYDGENAQTLLRNADAAMYQAKANGRNNYQIYFEEINAGARMQFDLETDLRKAIDSNELFLCYQPQVDLRNGQWIGLEALIRWQHPTLGLISPARFIPIAEETGMIEPIGRWVLEQACAQYRKWRQIGFPKLRLAVNLSAHQFHRSNLVRSIMQILKNTEFDPCDLELEVTESAAMHDVGFAIKMLQKLSDSGMQIAMDDFGTGYSSLSVLKHFPLDTIKIDRSFVMDLVDSPSDAAIAATIIALAKGLNFKVLAEGIETSDQARLLSKMGCDYAQGYWYSRPMNVEQIDDLLIAGNFYKIANLA